MMTTRPDTLQDVNLCVAAWEGLLSVQSEVAALSDLGFDAGTFACTGLLGVQSEVAALADFGLDAGTLSGPGLLGVQSKVAALADLGFDAGRFSGVVLLGGPHVHNLPLSPLRPLDKLDPILRPPRQPLSMHASPLRLDSLAEAYTPPQQAVKRDRLGNRKWMRHPGGKGDMDASL
jgi:hypothetical protein